MVTRAPLDPRLREYARAYPLHELFSAPIVLCVGKFLVYDASHARILASYATKRDAMRAVSAANEIFARRLEE